MANLVSQQTSDWLRRQQGLPREPRPTRTVRPPRDLGGDESAANALPDPGPPPEPTETVPSWVSVWVWERVTQDDVDDDATLVLGAWILCNRYVWAGPRRDYEPTVPHFEPEA